MRLFFFFAMLFTSILGMCRNLPILNPHDPQFNWMDTIINQDFSHFNRKIHWSDYARSLQVHKDKNPVIRFRIIDNCVQGPKTACYYMLEYLCNTYHLPDLDFLYWEQDGPVKTLLGEVPVLTGIRRLGTANTILFGMVWIFNLINPQGPWNSALTEIDENCLPWSEREGKLFWRGAATDIWSAGPYSVDNWFKHVRGKACALSIQFPDHIDAAITHFQPFGTKGSYTGIEELKKIIPTTPPISITTHLKYKYQFQAAGVVGNFPRDVWQLYSESVCFRHPYLDEVYWSILLKPWEHYIPIEVSLDDLIEKIEWARDHDAECYEIANRARAFAESHFMPEHIALYCYKVLMKYATIQGFNQQLP